MKSFIIFIVSILWYSLPISAQVVSNDVATSPFIKAYDLNGRPLTRPAGSVKIEGSPLLNPDGGTATVYLKGGSRAEAVELQFNLYKNELYFKRNEIFYIIEQPVDSFHLIFSEGDSIRDMFFKSGYPRQDKRGAVSFYHVVEEGPHIHLLEYLYVNLVDAYQYGGSEKMRYKMGADLYLYRVKEEKLVRIKSGSKSLMTELPEYKPVIQDFLRTHPANPLKLDDLQKLVRLLNQLG
jgi:hypothetical protein